MVRRASGGYDRGIRKARVVTPVLVIACEGETEAGYMKHLARDYNIRVQAPVYAGLHGRALVDKAISYAEQVKEEHKDSGANVHTAVMFDAERLSNQNIQAIIEDVAYARKNNVEVWVNLPIIERWLMLHFKFIGLNRSKSVIAASFDSVLSSLRLAPFVKPGDSRFFSNLRARARDAKANCSSSHPYYVDSGEIPCLCTMLDFLEQFSCEQSR